MTVESTSAAAALGPQETSLLALAETLASLIALIQGDRLVYVDPAGGAILGRFRERLVGGSLRDRVRLDDRLPVRTAPCALSSAGPRRS